MPIERRIRFKNEWAKRPKQRSVSLLKLFSSYYFDLIVLSAMNGITLIRKPIGQMMKIGSSRKDFETSSLVHQFDNL